MSTTLETTDTSLLCVTLTVVATLFLAFVGRVALASVIGLAPDEAYYSLWSESLALGYPDHPPAVAWLIAAARALCGDSNQAIRLPALVLGGALLPAALWWLGLEVGLSRRTALVLPLASVVQPLGVAAGLIMTPDVPLLLCWTVAAAASCRARRTGSTLAWVIAGAALGGALLSKHSGWLLIATVGGALLFDREGWHQLRRSGPWIGLALGLAIAAPNLLWDAARGYPSLGFQLSHGLLPTEPWRAPLRVLELMAAQIGLLTPIVAWGSIWAIRRGAPPDPSGRLLFGLAIAPLLLFGAAALLAQPEANWPAPAHPPLLALTLRWLEQDLESGRRSLARHRRLLASALVTSALFTGGAAVHLLYPLPFFPPDHEPAARLRAWHDLPSWLSTDLPLAAEDYELAAALSHHLPGHPRVAICCPEDMPCSGDIIALTTTTGRSQPVVPAWLSRENCRASLVGRHPMRRSDGAIVRWLIGHRLVCDDH